jgi:twinkle protein
MIEQTQCPKCPSSDGYTVYEDHAHCYVCKYHVTFNKEKPVEGTSKQIVPWRGISEKTFKKYGSYTEVASDGEPLAQVFPWGEAQLHRRFTDEKKNRFYWRGPVSPGVYGKDAFSPGSSKAITITEGAMDAMSVYEMMGWPAVAVKSVDSAKADLKADYDYINSFEKIYLCFDSDEPGQKAFSSVAQMFDFNKVYRVRMDRLKDANEYLQEKAQEEFKRVWWNSKRFTPDNIISSYSEIDKLLNEAPVEAHAAYPFKRLQEMTFGMRPGEVILLKAMEGIGKTEFIRAIEYNVLKETDHNIGIIHLEENKTRSIKGLAGYQLQMPVHLPDTTLDPKQVSDAYRTLTRRDDRLNIYSHFGSEDPDDILNGIRFMAGVLDCRLIFLDHISMIVSGIETEDERKKLDYISTQLKMMAEQLQFTLVEISHVNDAGLTRGSRNISKAADLVLSLNRDITAENEQTRNTTALVIEKNRFAGLTGPAGAVFFDRETFTLIDSELDFGVPF